MSRASTLALVAPGSECLPRARKHVRRLPGVARNEERVDDGTGTVTTTHTAPSLKLAVVTSTTTSVTAVPTATVLVAAPQRLRILPSNPSQHWPLPGPHPPPDYGSRVNFKLPVTAESQMVVVLKLLELSMIII